MWLYRAYSGNLYHGGEIQNKTLPQFTQDDSITCILDTDARTLSFAKNDEDPQVLIKKVFPNLFRYDIIWYRLNNF